MLFETLETRSLMSATLDPSTGVLTVLGKSGADRILVSQYFGEVHVDHNSVRQTFPAAAVSYVSVFGLDGNDTIRATDAVSRPVKVNGGAGNDRIRGGGAGDNLVGGAGDDFLEGGLGADTFWGGPGGDTVSYAAADTAVFASLDDARNDGRAGENDFIRYDVEHLEGGGSDDYLVGNAANNTLSGWGGNDALVGGDGNDVILGGHGNDTVLGGAGDDYLVDYYGSGTDYLYGEGGNDNIQTFDGGDWLFGGDGDDTLASYGDYTYPDHVDGGDGYDRASRGGYDIVTNCEEVNFAY